MKRWKRTFLGSALEIAALLLLHRWLLLRMAGGTTASAILAAGRHVPVETLATAGLFLLVRFLAVVCLPGLILARVGMVLFDLFSPVETRAGRE